MKKTDTLPATLSALLQEYSIAEGIQMAEQQVRENPAKALCRHSLFQLLCVAGDWSRALHQLQLCARMEANYTQEARYLSWSPAACISGYRFRKYARWNRRNRRA